MSTKEYERKFTVQSDLSFLEDAFSSVSINQGYLASAEKCVVRARQYGDVGFITIKSSRKGMEAYEVDEFEYEIPLHHAQDLIKNVAESSLYKTRYLIKHNELVFEVDVFHGRLQGLVLAELELVDPDELLNAELPSWIIEDVTGNSYFSNFNLSRRGL